MMDSRSSADSGAAGCSVLGREDAKVSFFIVAVVGIYHLSDCLVRLFTSKHSVIMHKAVRKKGA